MPQHKYDKQQEITAQGAMQNVNTLFYVRSKYCGTIVDNVKRIEKKAEKLVVKLNDEAIELDSDVRYEKIPVNGC